MEILLIAAEWIGVVAFAISGAMVGVRKNFDLFGVMLLSVITSFGGGIIRDLLLGHIPPRFFTNYGSVLTAVIASLIVFLFFSFFQDEEGKKHDLVMGIMNLFDAIGLAAFTVTGCGYAFQAGYENKWLLVISVGVITGIGGGMLRDTMAGEPQGVLRKHIYALAAIGGAVIYYFWTLYFPAKEWATPVSMLVIILVRLAAAHFKWNLPKTSTIRRLRGKQTEREEAKQQTN